MFISHSKLTKYFMTTLFNNEYLCNSIWRYVKLITYSKRGKINAHLQKSDYYFHILIFSNLCAFAEFRQL